MRSPSLVFSLIAVSALSPTFVVGSPLPTLTDSSSVADRHRTNSNPVAPRGLGFVFARTEPKDVPRAAPTSKPKVATLAGYTLGYVRIDILTAVSADECHHRLQWQEAVLAEGLLLS
ncbi:hypothetical protein BC835DRAFT_3447 [Cytidiella melzeri]|nr:hypothetical protein BC835DRAFT_3447 [Cytidiella melzeri]